MARRKSWDAMTDLVTMQQAMDRLFDEARSGRGDEWRQGQRVALLPVDVYSTANELVIKAAVAGVEPDGSAKPIHELIKRGKDNSPTTKDTENNRPPPTKVKQDDQPRPPGDTEKVIAEQSGPPRTWFGLRGFLIGAAIILGAGVFCLYRVLQARRR